MKEMVFENRSIEKLEREYKSSYIQIPKELEYNTRKKEEYFEKIELQKIESINAIGIAFITIVVLPLITLLVGGNL